VRFPERPIAIIWLAGTLLVASLVGAGCHGHAGCPRALQAAADSTTWVRTELYFGLARKDQPPVTDEQWQAFVDEQITPRFPDGLTIIPAQGQWREVGVVVKEPSRLVIIFRPCAADAREANAKIESIRAAYKAAFNQTAVLRADALNAVSFGVE
jgi:hypothetical protein